MEQKIIKINNFRLNIFRNLLDQSLIVDNQIMLEISSEMIRSCSFSFTKSFMKLWTIPLKTLIIVPEEIDGDDFDFPGVATTNVVANIAKKVESISFPKFNLYILKGDLFKKFMSVHNTDMVDLEFTLHNINDKWQAANITIRGKSENNSPLLTSFILTTEDLISNIIDDYSLVLRECTPTENMAEYILTDVQIQEVKRLIKKLHKSSSNNTSFLTFTVDSENKKITVNDKVFTIDFNINIDFKFPVKSFKFNILKSDFIMTGNHTFTIYTNDVEQKVIFGAIYAGSIIWGLSSKVNESTINLDDSIMDSTIDSLELDEYLK